MMYESIEYQTANIYSNIIQYTICPINDIIMFLIDFLLTNHK